MSVPIRKKLIEVALPLEAINIASAREKSIRHGHPSTLHLWWARRPLAAARAVIFAQMVDDPSCYVDVLRSDSTKRRRAERLLKDRKQVWDEATEYARQMGDAAKAPGPEPTLDDILAEQERERLFRLIEKLVLWENTTNEEVLRDAREEIWQSWRRTCAENATHPRASELFDRHKLPAFHDPFAGGGALPLEAQRLGLESYASDLNPVPVLINKAMIEIPPKFARQRWPRLRGACICFQTGGSGDSPQTPSKHTGAVSQIPEFLANTSDAAVSSAAYPIEPLLEILTQGELPASFIGELMAARAAMDHPVQTLLSPHSFSTNSIANAFETTFGINKSGGCALPAR